MLARYYRRLSHYCHQYCKLSKFCRTHVPWNHVRYCFCTWFEGIRVTRVHWKHVRYKENIWFEGHTGHGYQFLWSVYPETMCAIGCPRDLRTYVSSLLYLPQLRGPKPNIILQYCSSSTEHTHLSDSEYLCLCWECVVRIQPVTVSHL